MESDCLSWSNSWLSAAVRGGQLGEVRDLEGALDLARAVSPLAPAGPPPRPWVPDLHERLRYPRVERSVALVHFGSFQS